MENSLKKYLFSIFYLCKAYHKFYISCVHLLYIYPLLSRISCISQYGILVNILRSSSVQPNAMAIFVSESSVILPDDSNLLIEP